MLSDLADVGPFLSDHEMLACSLTFSCQVQDTFDKVMTALRNTLRVIAAPFHATAHASEEDVGFTPLQVAHPEAPVSQAHELGHANQLCVQVCIAFLARAPILQSGTFNATRDKQMTDLLLGCELSEFLTLAPEYFQAVRSKQMHLSIPTAEKLLDRMELLLSGSYAFTRSVAATSASLVSRAYCAEMTRYPSA